MDPIQGKEKAKNYYDQEANKYLERYDKNKSDEKKTYPANLIRLDIVADLLKKRNAKTVLDAGAGSGGPMIRLLKEGFVIKGFDFAPQMVETGKLEFTKLGYDPHLLFVGDLEDSSSFPTEQFDAVLALGVFPHIVDDKKALSNMRNVTAKNGRVIIEFRNDLFAAYTLNAYSLKFYLENVIGLSSFPSDVAKEVRKFYEERFLPQTDRKKQGEKIAYTEILAKFHNPLTIEKELFEPCGFKIEQILFYHYHALPPFFQEKYPELFRERSLQMEHPSDWRGYLMCSAFLAEATIKE